jgi:hypothetical protein
LLLESLVKAIQAGREIRALLVGAEEVQVLLESCALAVRVSFPQLQVLPLLMLKEETVELQLLLFQLHQTRHLRTQEMVDWASVRPLITVRTVGQVVQG